MSDLVYLPHDPSHGWMRAGRCPNTACQLGGHPGQVIEGRPARRGPWITWTVLQARHVHGDTWVWQPAPGS